jgi:hypothetical protein
MPKIHPQAIPYSKPIANKIKSGIKSGLNIKQIFGSIQSLQNAPGSIQTFYKLYGKDIEEQRAEIVGKVGKKVIDQALEGDFKSQEFFLRSRGDWSPQSTETVVEADSTDEDVNAIDALMSALGKLDEEPDESEDSA